MQLDHITFACQSLTQAQTFALERFGVTLPEGGAHHEMATHNLLTRIAPHTFLEFIAINPSVAAPPRPRWFNLDGFEQSSFLSAGPRLIGWVASVPDIHAALRFLPFAVGESVGISRGKLNWKMAISKDGSLPMKGFAPTLIEWAENQSPVSVMQEVGVRLAGFAIHHPLAANWHKAAKDHGWDDLAADHAMVTWVSSERENLQITLQTPKGLVHISQASDF